MATLDALNRLADDLDCGAGAATAASSSVKVGSSGADADHGLTAFNHGMGATSSASTRLRVVVTEAFATSTTARVQLRQGSTAAVDADVVILADSGALALAAGPDTVGFYMLDVPLPDITDQWIDVLYTGTGSNASAGMISAWIQLNVDHGHGVIQVTS